MQKANEVRKRARKSDDSYVKYLDCREDALYSYMAIDHRERERNARDDIRDIVDISRYRVDY